MQDSVDAVLDENVVKSELQSKESKESNSTSNSPSSVQESIPIEKPVKPPKKHKKKKSIFETKVFKNKKSEILLFFSSMNSLTNNCILFSIRMYSI